MKNIKERNQLLVVLSIDTSKGFRFLTEVLNLHGDSNSMWLVVDRVTMEKLVSEGLLRDISSDKMIVYTGRNPEETALRIFALTKPSLIYVCDERSSLQFITRFLAVTGVEMRNC